MKNTGCVVDVVTMNVINLADDVIYLRNAMNKIWTINPVIYIFMYVFHCFGYFLALVERLNNATAIVNGFEMLCTGCTCYRIRFGDGRWKYCLVCRKPLFIMLCSKIHLQLSVANMTRTSILLLVLLLSACAGIQVENPLHSPRAEDVAHFNSMPPMDAVKEVENALAQAKKDEFDYFAPDHFRMAHSAVSEARDFMLRNAPREHVAGKVAVADAVLKNGQLVIRNIKSILKDELVQKEKLESMNASRQYGQEFDNLVDRLGQIIRQIENGKIAEASKQRPALRNDLDNLEMRAVVYNSLHEPREMMRRVKNGGGETQTPFTYADASEVLMRAEQFIQNNYKDKQAVDKIAAEALFAARRALYLTEEVAALSHKVSRSLEQLVLDEEYRLFRIARSLPVKDIRDNPLEVQSEIIARAAADVSVKADEQAKLARMYQSQLENDDQAVERINAMNDAVRNMEKDRGNWQASKALYEARVSQLEVVLETE